ncbi:MAG: ribosome maturation factor RimP [Clostridium sp.]|nr:ribosome maturation factor RimP [Clostridium sp.]MCM1172645.1 ribosome maturation factor RimP [Clostridium sp.]MCM1207694.1 ribosome maturation factor RimP [Ruminococcus sp.]
MKKTEIEQHCTELVTPIIKDGDFELVDVEYVKEGADFYLRVYADKPGGITIDDCVLISRALEERLDAEDKIKDAYILEVSSPGLTRPLKKEKDFARSIGKLVDVKLYRQVNNSKELTGVLMAYNEEEVQLMLDHADAHEELTINRKDISMIRLAFV